MRRPDLINRTMIRNFFRPLYLTEGLNDKGSFKVVFMAGGSGAGKDTVLKHTLKGLPLKELDSDDAFEFLIHKRGLDPRFPDEQAKERDETRERAKAMTKARQKMWFQERHGLIINGTGDDLDKTRLMKDELERMGYDTAMVFVNVTNDESRRRNIMRGETIDPKTGQRGRTVPEHIRREKWEGSMKALDQYKKMFGDNFSMIDSSRDLFGSPEDRAAREEAHMEVHRKMKNFVERPPRLEAAREWYIAKSKMRNSDPDQIQRHVFAKFSPDERRDKPVQEDPRIDYHKLSNMSLAQRRRYGDQRAAQVLAQREREESIRMKGRIAA